MNEICDTFDVEQGTRSRQLQLRPQLHDRRRWRVLLHLQRRRARNYHPDHESLPVSLSLTMNSPRSTGRGEILIILKSHDTKNRLLNFVIKQKKESTIWTCLIETRQDHVSRVVRRRSLQHIPKISTYLYYGRSTHYWSLNQVSDASQWRPRQGKPFAPKGMSSFWSHALPTPRTACSSTRNTWNVSSIQISDRKSSPLCEKTTVAPLVSHWQSKESSSRTDA